MAETTVEKFLARTVRLYEQERRDPFGPPLLGLYAQSLYRPEGGGGGGGE